jgi:hypothetical protein
MHLGRRRRLPDFRHGLGDGGLLAPVDDHFRAHLRQSNCGREPDAAGRAGNERGLSSQIEIHALLPKFLIRRLEPLPFRLNRNGALVS